jgi:hypothetical protein
MSIVEQVTAYIVSAMISWVPLGNQIERTHDGHWVRDGRGLYVVEDTEAARARYERIASEIVSVAFDEANSPLFKGDDGRLKTALALASIASFEGGYHRWVENGDCNSKEFQARQKEEHRAECDGGAAWSIFQLHMYRYVIRDGEMTQAQYLENSLVPGDRDWIRQHQDEIIHGVDVVKDTRLAVLVAYYLVRYSTKNFKSLCAYSGEDCAGTHPKATARLQRAAEYLRAHPFKAVDEEAREERIRQQIFAIMMGQHSPDQEMLRAFTARGLFAMSVPQPPQVRLD